jgi:hypothetical protein
MQARIDALQAELAEARERESATAEVLAAINSSSGDLGPVFDAMLGKALDLCGASCGHFRTSDGESLHLVAARGVPDAYAEFLRTPVRPSAETPLGRLLRGERVVVVLDAAAEELYRVGEPLRRAYVDLGGARSAVDVAPRQGRQVAGYLDGLPPGGATVHRKADRAIAELRGAGGRRDGKRAADQ